MKSWEWVVYCSGAIRNGDVTPVTCSCSRTWDYRTELNLKVSISIPASFLLMLGENRVNTVFHQINTSGAETENEPFTLSDLNGANWVDS